MTALGISPIFPVGDLDASLGHYRRMGFAIRVYAGGSYGYAARDGVEIHLGVVAADRVRRGSAYLFVADADRLAEEWRAAGVDVHPPVDTEWGQREGAVVDPDGNVIRFGSPLSERTRQPASGAERPRVRTAPVAAPPAPTDGCDEAAVTEYDAWDRRTAMLLEDAYVAAGAGPRGCGSTDASEGGWRAKRQHLAVPMDRDGSWLDVGCANGHLLVTLPMWAAERGVTVRPYGLELLPTVAALARSLHPELADRIWTGSVMTWSPPVRFRYMTALTDLVPPGRLVDLVERLLEHAVEAGGRLILSRYTSTGERTRSLVDDLVALGHPPDGVIHIDRPGRSPLLTAWLDV